MMKPLQGHLLIVEDSDMDFETCLDASRLANVHNEIRRATLGDERLQLRADLELRRRALPILVLLDLNTPKGEGRDGLRGIVRNERLRAIPLVVITASANSRDISFCYDHGANAYHLKPVSYPFHLEILRNIFLNWLTSAVLPELEGSNRS
jgi:CheY-like chemotaxis protein